MTLMGYVLHMTNEAQTKDMWTERDEFFAAAKANGWVVDGGENLWGASYVRGAETLSVRFNFLHVTCDTGEVRFGKKNGKKIDGSKKMFAALV